VFEILLLKEAVPALEDINNESVKRLAERLKGRSDKETLTNILEWQEKNILYWADRWHIPSLIAIFIFIVALIFGLIFGLREIALGVVVGILAFVFAFLKLKYRSIRASNPEFSLWDTFKPSLPVGKILGYRLAICRDYAKLTAALLLNLYPSSEIYLIAIPRHVAAGIKFNRKVYVLDQKLPVASLERWLSVWKEKRNKKKLKANVYRLIQNKELKAEKVGRVIMDKDFIPEVNLERLTNAVVAEMGVKQVSERSRPDLEIPLKNFAIYYEPDEIVEFSLIRAIKNKIESEFCGNLDKISKIEILQDKNDLILRVKT
jgi:predicted transglutaminase-like protease